MTPDFSEMFEVTTMEELCQICKMEKIAIHMVAIKEKKKSIIELCRDCGAAMRMKAKRNRNV